MQKYKDMSEAQQAIVKTFILVLVIIVALVLWDTASATGKNNTINNYYEVTEVSSTNYSGINNEDLSEAVAKASACGANFYYGTNKKQGAVHGVYYDGESEICFEAAWRPKDSAVMWDIGIVPDEDSDLILWRGGVQFEF